MWYAYRMWLLDSDRRPMGAPETVVELPGDVTFGLYIPAPFGPYSDAVLAIRAVETDEPGGVITMAITQIIDRETRRIDTNLQSNPIRRRDEHDFRKGFGL